MWSSEQLNTGSLKLKQAAENLFVILQQGVHIDEISVFSTAFSWARISLHSSKKIQINISTFLIPNIIMIFDGSVFENGNVLLNI